MANRHVGQECFGCHQKLQEDDDIVVCPECGTPYHRACWQKTGHCLNAPLHASGKSWDEVLAEQEDTVRLTKVCPNCGTKNKADTSFCQGCGKPLVSEEPEPQTFQERMQRRMEDAGETLDTVAEAMDESADSQQELDGEPMKDVANFVSRNVLYYLPRFQRFYQWKSRISVNFPCLFFPQLYFANRKMWPLALILVGVFSLLQLPAMVETFRAELPNMIYMAKHSEESLWTTLQPQMVEMLQGMQDKLDAHESLLGVLSNVGSYLGIAVKIVLGLLGNWLYYRFVLKKVHRIREQDLSEAVRNAYLRSQGGTNGWLILGMIALEYVLLLLMMSVVIVVLML